MRKAPRGHPAHLTHSDARGDPPVPCHGHLGGSHPCKAILTILTVNSLTDIAQTQRPSCGAAMAVGMQSRRCAPCNGRIELAACSKAISMRRAAAPLMTSQPPAQLIKDKGQTLARLWCRAVIVHCARGGNPCLASPHSLVLWRDTCSCQPCHKTSSVFFMQSPSQPLCGDHGYPHYKKTKSGIQPSLLSVLSK